MKWKSVSPEAKRRSSNSFLENLRTNYYTNNTEENYDYNYNNYASNYDQSYNYDYNLNYHNYPGYRNRFLDDYYYLDLISKNEQIREQFHAKDSRFAWQQDDQQEDDLYFHGGERSKKKNQNLHKDIEYNVTKFIGDDNTYDNDDDDNIEYDPINFESENEPSSSWSDESEVELSKSKSKKRKSSTSHKSSKSTEKSEGKIEEFDYGVIKPKSYVQKVIDLDAPTITKLPSNPIPNTWAHLIHNPLRSLSRGDPGCIEICTSSISQDEKWLKDEGIVSNGSNVKGILMKPPFSDNFSVKQWAELMLKTILPHVLQDGGYLFVWVEREQLAQVIRAAEKYLFFKYVENLCWIRRDLNNKIIHECHNQDGNEDDSHLGLFYKSKITLLILRRDPNNRCKLRHQRNPDCVFDFVGPGRMPDGRVYDIIETLLDPGNAAGEKPHLMHLWASSSPTDRLVYRNRKHWIRVMETSELDDDVDDIDDKNEDEENDDSGSIPQKDDSKEIDPNHNVNSMNSNLNSSTFDEDFCNFILSEPIL